MIVDEQAIQYFSPNQNSRYGVLPAYVICHGTAGGGAKDWFRNPQNTDSSANYVVEVSGNIYCCVPEDAMAWANGPITTGAAQWWYNVAYGNPNFVVISIEFEKLDNGNNNELTPAQITAGFGLIDRITKRWGIARRLADATGGITGHFSIDPVNRSHCPGPFPWPELWAFLGPQNEELIMLQIGQGMGVFFEDRGGNPQRWHCKPSNVDLIGENLAFWRKYRGVWGLPLTNEIYLKALSGGALVVCERAIQFYDPQYKYDNPGVDPDDKCYLLHIDQGIGRDIVAKPLVDALKKQIDELQQEIAGLKTITTNQELEKQYEAAKAALKVVYTTAQPFV